MNEQLIQDFFHSHRPVTSDEGTYLTGLKSKLDAVEEIKRIRDFESARCRKRVIVAFAFGMVAGAFVAAFIILRPVRLPQFNTELFSSIALFVSHWKKFIMASIAISALVLGLITTRRASSQRG